MLATDTTSNRLEILRNACSTLENQSSTDNYPDLYRLWKGGVRQSLEESSSNYKHIFSDSFKKIPDSILRQYETLQCRSFMGIMSEINRVWLTIDNRLYLWNYEKEEGEIINEYEDQDQIIVHVGLAKPVPGVFLDQIEYVLIVSTPLEIILLGLAFKEPNEKGTRGSMTIYRTEMSVSSDNVNMTNIQGTDQGRIFMRGNNGNLYELIYQAQDGWLTRKIRKINHSAAGVALFVPAFLQWASEDAITDFLIDKTRNVLYAVTKNNQIDLYYLGLDGTGFSKKSRVSNLLQKATSMCDNTQTPLDERNFQIISIHSVSFAECRQVNLVAITSTGHRLYFTHTREFDRFTSPVEPEDLKLLFVRPPPIHGSLQYHSGKIHQGFYANGVTLVAQAYSEDQDKILCFGLDSGAISQSLNQNSMIETLSSIEIDGKTWAITEARTRHFVAMKTAHEGSDAYLNELVTQFEYPQRVFYVLTSNGIQIVTKNRPLDILTSLLEKEKKAEIPKFFEIFGRDQSCAMSLAIASGHIAVNASQQISTNASRLYFEMGGSPTLGNGNSPTKGGPFGIPMTSIDVKYSAKHNGLVLYLSRLLRPIWKKELIPKTDKAKQAVLNVDDLINVQSHLISLDRFLKQNPRFTAAPTPDSRPTNIDAEAWKSEQQSLANLHELLQQTIEVISFVSIMIDYSIPTLASRLTQADQNELKGLTFEGFVSTSKGKEVSKALMSALVNLQIERDISLDSIVNSLQQRCPSICEGNDVILFKGIELVQTARLTSNPSQQNKLLSDALNLFGSALPSITQEKLKDIVENFKSLGYYSGVVDLVLLYAGSIYPLDNLSITASQTTLKRYDCYKLIFDMIEDLDQSTSYRSNVSEVERQRDNVISKALNSQDVAFHEAFYDWLIKHGWIERLLKIQTPYLEYYLIKEKDIRERADILWKYYVQIGKFIEAAKVMLQISQTPDNMRLQERMEYLTKAITNAKSAEIYLTGENQSLLSELSDLLDVANVQAEILNLCSSNPERAEAAIELDRRLFDLNSLYHSFAKPYEMHHVILMILHLADQSNTGRQMAEKAWTDIINQCKHDASLKAQSPLDSIIEIVKQLGSLLYPSETSFPMRFLVSKLEQLAFELGGVNPDWLISVFLQLNIPFQTIFQTYNELFDQKPSPWSNNRAITHLLAAITALLDLWINGAQPGNRDFPARYIDDAINRYIVTLDQSPLLQPLRQIQEKLRSLF